MAAMRFSDFMGEASRVCELGAAPFCQKKRLHSERSAVFFISNRISLVAAEPIQRMQAFSALVRLNQLV